MGRRSGPSMLKRQKELARQQRQQQKAERRKARSEQTRTDDGSGAADPDIAGIIPGPQPKQPEHLDEDKRPDDDNPPNEPEQ